MAERTCTFAFVDLAGYTALTEAHGDEGAADCASRFYALAEGALEGDARIVKRIGDAVMLVAASPVACVRSVRAMFARADVEVDFPGLRAGVATGPAVERDGDFFGAAVNLAARISAHARAGELLCDHATAAALADQPGVRVVTLGEVSFKNVGQPVAVFSALATDGPPSNGWVDPVCRMRVARPRLTLRHEGRRYAFCSDACAERFAAAPASFLRGEE